MRFRNLSLGCALIGLGLAACAPQYVPPTPAAPRAATSVAASFANSWDAVVRALDERSAHITSMDRATGVILSESQHVSVESPDLLADCGRSNNTVLGPTDVMWNVQIQGDSSSSTVKASAAFSRAEQGTVGIPGAAPHGTTRQCESRGVWERELEQRVRALAERKQRGAA